jgi:2',3'-cyclic-nucleotide 2'-phosphodiesterase/3'-nucleotidase
MAVLASAVTSAAGSESVRLTVLHTSDLHGQVLAFDDARNRPASGSLAQVATLVDEIRREADHPVLLLDSGDTIQGSPLEQFVHVRWSEPSPTIAAMNLIGYDAMAVGNHEFNFGLEVLRRAEQQAEFPFLAANAVDESGQPAFPPHVVVEVESVRVGLLGLVTPNIPAWERPENYRGLRFEAMDEAARKWVPRLRQQERCDLVVALAHTGFERNPVSGEDSGTWPENFGWRLSRVEGIDLLLTGHTHQALAPTEINGMIVSQPRARAQLLTRIDLWLERTPAGWRIARWEGTNLPVGEVASSPRVEKAFEPVRARVAAALDSPITSVTAPVSVRGCRLADCAAVDLIHAAQLAASEADLSLASLLSSATPKLEPGPVTWRWVHGLYVYPNNLHVIELSGAQVKDVLEHAARFYEGLDCEPGAGCAVLTNPEVRGYNVDTMAGISYRIDPTRPEGDRVRDLRYRGEPLDLHAAFKLVCNNYRAAGGGGYPHLADAPVVWTSSREVVDLIGEYLEAHDPWRPVVDGNWWIGADLRSRSSEATGGYH